MKQVEQARQQMPAEVERLVLRAVDTRLAAVKDAEGSIQTLKASNETLNRDLNGRMDGVVAEIAELKRALQRAESAALQATREAEAARLALSLRPAAAAATGEGTVGGGSAVMGTTESGRPIVVAPPQGELFSRVGDFRLDMLRRRIGSNGLVFEMTITKERGGDGVFQMISPRLTRKSRIVLADGIELRGGKFAVNNQYIGGSPYNMDLIEGVPMRLNVEFDGDIREATLCRRIEIHGRDGRSGQDIVFRFDDVLVSER
ncbi:MAG: hypothetical protein ACTS3F_05630 [Phycisphaerales bacterium]